jgi:hypothetical protein
MTPQEPGLQSALPWKNRAFQPAHRARLILLKCHALPHFCA